MKLILLVLMALNTSAYNLSDVVDKLIIIESNGDSKAIGDNGRAVCSLQIWKIMVDEANRLTKGKINFKYSDRLSERKSRQIAMVFLNRQIKRYYKINRKMPSDVILACSWNSGNIFKQLNQSYAKKYKELK